jgi:hypothetical protein
VTRARRFRGGLDQAKAHLQEKAGDSKRFPSGLEVSGGVVQKLEIR